MCNPKKIEKSTYVAAFIFVLRRLCRHEHHKAYALRRGDFHFLRELTGMCCESVCSTGNYRARAQLNTQSKFFNCLCQISELGQI